jgi:hypothetical protein
MAFPARHLTLAIIFVVLAVAPAAAQYRVHDWMNFNDGRLPERLAFGHYADETTVAPISMSNPAIPPVMRLGAAETEIGAGAVRFAPTGDRNHLSAVSTTSMERNRLGADGRALYQADFFLPAAGAPVPETIALLAVSAEEGSTSTTNYRMYRFGIQRGNRLFFAYADGVNPNPQIFLFQDFDQLGLQRPGWHRFQIIFFGQDTIYCAVDGRMTNFSPITEPSLTRMRPGMMVTRGERPPTDQVFAVADNLSIQWTPLSSPLPDSPWTAPTAAMLAGTTATRNIMEGNSRLPWLDNPTEAATAARADNRTILAMFFAPRIAPYTYLQGIVPQTDDSRALFEKFVLLRVDTNQLSGGTLAERFDVFRVPTFIKLDATGTEAGRLTVVNNQTTWEEISTFLNQ